MDIKSRFPICGPQPSVCFNFTTVHLGDSGLIYGVGQQTLSTQWTRLAVPDCLGAAAGPGLGFRCGLVLLHSLGVVPGYDLGHVWHGAVRNFHCVSVEDGTKDMANRETFINCFQD